MKITIESTVKTTNLTGVPARVWEGETESGIPVTCFVTRIVPRTYDGSKVSEFEKELTECVSPSEYARQLPMRLVL